MRFSATKTSTGKQVWVVMCESDYCDCENNLETERELTEDEIEELGWEVYHLSLPSETFCPSHHRNMRRHSPGCGDAGIPGIT